MIRVDKPWGYELIWARTAAYAGKILHVYKDHALSLQYHQHKDETILVHSGCIELTTYVDGEPPHTRQLTPGDTVHIPPGVRHQITALEATELFEVSTPELDDVVRLRDRYGRA